MKAIQAMGVGIVLLMLIMACQSPMSGTGGTDSAGNVIIKIAGSDGRTVQPTNPVFSEFVLTLQKEGETPFPVQNTTGITGAGVRVRLGEGNWTITLEAYRNVAGSGKVLAARGIAVIQVQSSDISKTVLIELKPLTIGESADPGVFSYSVTLSSESPDTAVLSLKNSNGDEMFGVNGLDLTEAGNLSGSKTLAPGYYDLSVILTRYGQSAGAFESVHIFSGLESPIDLDLSALVFADKVYITGTLDGIRLGSVSVASDASGNNSIKTIELNEVVSSDTSVIRSANWVIDIPASHVGEPVWVVQKFNDETSNIWNIDSVAANGQSGIVLNLLPATPALQNLVPWYATISASGTGGSTGNPSLAANGNAGNYWQSAEDNGSVWMQLDFGFNVNVNASRLVFYSQTVSSVFLDGYTVEYWDGLDWTETVHRVQHFDGSPDASVAYSNFFTEVTASQFRWKVTGLDGQAPGLIEFGLYKAADRSVLSAAIVAAEENNETTLSSATDDGEDIELTEKWVRAADRAIYENAIAAARTVSDDPLKTDGEISAAKDALDQATGIFNAAKRYGNSGDILVNNFHVRDGYKDKFVVVWNKEPAKKYYLSVSADNINWETPVEFNAVPGSNETHYNFAYTITAGTGTTRYFKIQASVMTDIEVFGAELILNNAYMTLGVPALSLTDSPSRRIVSLSWTAAQKADTYRIVYSIAGDSTLHAVELALSDLTSIAGGYAYSFAPNGFDNPIISGRKIDIYVEALNEALWIEDGGAEHEFTTTSNTVETRLVGPAELNATATQATQWDNIQLSWDSVEGAAGYYVFRRQFNLNNTAVANAETIAYYVPAGSGALAVTGKNVAATETTTVKASAANAGNRYTLTDSSMSDAEYNGAYSAYTANYKNQQNELAWGNAYRYFIVPVIASTDTVSFNASGNNVPYTITSGGETIAYNSAAELEKLGFTVGFGQNVVATKGTYASSGNTNNGIQITWDAPPLLAGVTPNYKLYGRAYGATNWVSANMGNTFSYTDRDIDGGIIWEYAIGINNSNPTDFSRFMNDSRAQLDGKGIPKGYGYMLNMVKLQGVSRTAIQVGNEFGEDVTFYNTGVNNGSTDKNWGIDGYTVFVMNRNINGNWHIIMDDVAAPSTTDATQVARVTTGMASADGRDLLRVLRDYKHYFKVRSYVLNDSGAKVYCPDPVWDYETLFAANRTAQDNANFIQTDYVKWGARQITALEFTKITTLAITWGMHISAGNNSGSWITKLTNSWTTANNNGSGRVGRQHSGSTRWWFYYDNYKPGLDTRANKGNANLSTTIVSINTGTSTSDPRIVVGYSSATGYYPTSYGRDGTYGRDYIDITGPTCVSPLYSGKLRFSNSNDANNLTWDGGQIDVQYPTGTTVQITGGGQNNTPLPFRNQPNGTASSGTRSNRTDNDEWY